MLRFEKNDNGTIELITDDKNAELALLDDEGFGDLVPAFNTTTLVDGEMRLVLPSDEEVMDDIESIIANVDRFAAEQLRALV